MIARNSRRPPDVGDVSNGLHPGCRERVADVGDTHDGGCGGRARCWLVETAVYFDDKD